MVSPMSNMAYFDVVATIGVATPDVDFSIFLGLCSGRPSEVYVTSVGL